MKKHTLRLRIALPTLSLILATAILFSSPSFASGFSSLTEACRRAMAQLGQAIGLVQKSKESSIPGMTRLRTRLHQLLHENPGSFERNLRNESPQEIRRLLDVFHRDLSALTPYEQFRYSQDHLIFQMTDGYFKSMIDNPMLGSRVLNDVAELHFRAMQEVIHDSLGLSVQRSDYRSGTLRLTARNLENQFWKNFIQTEVDTTPEALASVPKTGIRFLSDSDVAGLLKLEGKIQERFNQLLNEAVDPAHRDPSLHIRAEQIPLIQSIMEGRVGFGWGHQLTDAKFMARVAVTFPEIAREFQGPEFNAHLYQRLATDAETLRIELTGSPFVAVHDGINPEAVAIFRKFPKLDDALPHYRKLYEEAGIKPSEDVFRTQVAQFERLLKTTNVFEGHFHLPESRRDSGDGTLATQVERMLFLLKKAETYSDKRQKLTVISLLKKIDSIQSQMRDVLDRLGPRSETNFRAQIHSGVTPESMLLIDLDMKGLGVRGLIDMANAVAGIETKSGRELNPSLAQRLRESKTPAETMDVGVRDVVHNHVLRERMARTTDGFTRKGFQDLDHVTKAVKDAIMASIPESARSSCEISVFTVGDEITFLFKSQIPLDVKVKQSIANNIAETRSRMEREGAPFRAMISEIHIDRAALQSDPVRRTQVLEEGVRLAQEANEIMKNVLVKPSEPFRQESGKEELIPITTLTLTPDGRWVKSDFKLKFIR